MASNPPTNTPTGPATKPPYVRPAGQPGFNINDFKTNISLKGGTLKPTTYVVTFPNSGLDPSITYRTERVELPDVSLDSEKIRRWGYGPLEDVPYRPVFQPLRITLSATPNAVTGIVELVKKLSGTTPFMIGDLNASYSATNTNMGLSKVGGQYVYNGSPYEVAYKNDIIFATSVDIYNDAATKLFTYNFNDCFLRAISPIDLSWGATDQYVKIDMTIGYTDFYLT